jgi:DNA-binding NarL/FixJ family response regulator
VRTLIVDDSESVRDGLSMLLEAQPYCELVGAVADPDEALALTRALRPLVVLQDFSMPGVDPFRLVRALAACRPRPAVLVLSAFADAPSARQAIDAGAIGWVLKDSEPDDLFAALLGAARHRATRDTAPGMLEPDPAPDFGAALDARTVWALLRALEGDPGGMTVESLATRAVLPVALAVRYIQRLTSREPALVTPVDVDVPAVPRSYLLTSAGRRELARLERRIPTGHAGAAPQMLR